MMSRQKEKRDKMMVGEKLADFLIDVAKYLLTAVILTTFFEDVATKRWVIYLYGIIGTLLLLYFSIVVIKHTNK